ncbi:MAG: PA domain-containing protein [Bacteroidota bacterium]
MLKQYLLKLSFFAFALFACSNLANAQATVSIPGVGDAYALEGLFGADVAEVTTAELALVDDGMETTTDGCTDLMNDLTGKIALVDRGACAFVTKALTAQMAGAIAVIIANNDMDNPNSLFIPGGDDQGAVTIPTLGVTFATGSTLKTALEAGTLEISLLPSPNNLCVEAFAIEPGVYVVDSITADPVLAGLGGAPSTPSGGNVTAAVWYTYTPMEDGLMTVNTCLGGQDTRFFVHTGTCDALELNLTTLAGSDDACAYLDGNDSDLYASSVTLPVTGGVTYIIEFDNRWSGEEFIFNLAFEAGAVDLAPGQVCDNAIAIEAGMHTVESISPYGQTGVYNTNGSEWYAFTPNITGIMGVSSCGGGTDTRLLLHKGSCGNFETIIGDTRVIEAELNTRELDDACPAFEGDTNNLASAVEGLLVEAGVTYYIEWSGIHTTDGFNFMVTLDNLPPVNGTFTVDMTNEVVGDDGVIMVYAPSDATSQADAVVVVLSDEDGDGKWSGTTQLTTSDTIGYFFINGALAPANFEMVPDDCGVDSGLGFKVRPFVVTAASDFEVDAICFSKCTSCAPEDCSEPLELINDDFEGYTEGAVGPQAAHWTTWSGAEAEEGLVSSEVAHEGAQAMKIQGEGSGGPQDVLLLLDDKQDGHYILRWEMFIADSSGAYYNIQKQATEPGAEFGMQIQFNTDGTANLDAAGGDAAVFSYTQGDWMLITHYIDLDNDVIRLYIENEFIHSWPASATTGGVGGALQLGAVDFFPTSGVNLFYIDDVYFAQIPAAAPGQYCYLAEDAVEGTNTVPGIDCFGAGFSVRSNGNGTAGHWFKYTAQNDGAIAVGSCDNGGQDTRLWVFGGDCGTLPLLGMSDDMCPMGADLASYASYREVPVSAGETYYIVYDNVWDNGAFDWTLTEIPGELAAGDFCESAIAIEPGTISIDTLSGDAAVAGPSIGTGGVNTTPYANSRFYQFTAPENGLMSVYTCEGIPDETVLYIYTGTCGLDSLQLIASDAGGCDAESETRLIDAVAGTTYYIEWASESGDSREGFEFEFEFGGTQVDVTFEVDMNLLANDGDLSAQGAFINGSFTDGSVQMEDADGDNVFTYSTRLFKGDSLTWNYSNGRFRAENIADDAACAMDGVRVGVVGDEATTFGPVCFSYCVTCPEVVSTDETFEARALNVFPNPVTDVAVVEYRFDAATDIIISLTNTLGQQVRTLRIPNALVGTQRINVADLPTGSYALDITDGVRKQTQIIVVQ